MRSSSRVVVAICLCLVLFCSAQAQSRDGRTWNRFTEGEKFVYVAGFFDGNEHATRVVIEAAVKSATDPKSGLPIVEKAESVRFTIQTTEAVDASLVNVAPAQVIEGLDKTYSDYRNHRVRLPDAVSAVMQSIKGASEAEITRFLEAKRRETTK